LRKVARFKNGGFSARLTAHALYTSVQVLDEGRAFQVEHGMRETIAQLDERVASPN
jgi:hypothetical protein